METRDCRYRLLGESSDPLQGINEFTLLTSSERAIDQWLRTMSDLYAGVVAPLGHEHASIERPVRIIIRVRPRLIPLVYLLQAYQRWERAHPTRIPARVVILYRSAMLMMVMGRISSLVRPTDDIRFFSADQQAEAMAWLNTSD